MSEMNDGLGPDSLAVLRMTVDIPLDLARVPAKQAELQAALGSAVSSYTVGFEVTAVPDEKDQIADLATEERRRLLDTSVLMALGAHEAANGSLLRVSNALRHTGIYTLCDLLVAGSTYVAGAQNIAAKTLDTVDAMLESQGLLAEWTVLPDPTIDQVVTICDGSLDWVSALELHKRYPGSFDFRVRKQVSVAYMVTASDDDIVASMFASRPRFLDDEQYHQLAADYRGRAIAYSQAFTVAKAQILADR